MVLVVDDDEFQHKIISKMLDDRSYHLVFATGGVEALSILRYTRPDLILMDVVMPDMDGREVVRKIKTVHRLAGIPVIMMTGKGDNDVITESLKVGVIGFIVKPFSRDTLLVKVAKVLRGT
jgi:CheY-like chemotaxis protein